MYLFLSKDLVTETKRKIELGIQRKMQNSNAQRISSYIHLSRKEYLSVFGMENYNASKDEYVVEMSGIFLMEQQSATFPKISVFL